MRRIIADQLTLVPWLLKRMEVPFTKGFQAIGIINEHDEILGGVGYDWWMGRSCEMHTYGVKPGWATPRFMQAIFVYPFIQRNIKVITVRVGPETLRLNQRLGFTVDFVLKDGAFDSDLYYMSMRKENCRWLERKKHGQESSTAAATA